MDEKKIKTLAEIEKEAILDSMERHHYSISAVSEELDVPRWTLYKLVLKHDIRPPKTNSIMN